MDSRKLINSPREIVLLSQAKRALAEAGTIDDIRAIRDKAEAARKYAASACLGLEIQNHAAEIKLRAERKAGELLAELRLRGGDRRSDSRPASLRLQDIGVNKDQSSRWQLEACVSVRDFETFLTREREAGRELTSAGLIKLAKRLRACEETVASSQCESGDCHVVTELEELVGSGLRFACIYADPPWRYGNQGTRAATGNHYPTMSVPEICEMPIGSLAEERAHLHLWTTNGFLFDARLVLEAWGFAYKSCLVWVKPQMGLGNYWRVAHEFLLLGVRGGLPFGDRSMRSWVVAKRAGHSVKPEAVRQMIETVSLGPYLELFGRRRIPGWTVFGNQVGTE